LHRGSKRTPPSVDGPSPLRFGLAAAGGDVGGTAAARESALGHVEPYQFDPGSNIVDMYIRKLREKIDAGHPVKLLHSVRGTGYVMKEEA